MPYRLIKVVTDPFPNIVLYGALQSHWMAVGKLAQREYVLGRARQLGYVAENRDEAIGERRGLLRLLNISDIFRRKLGVYEEIKL